MCGIVFTQIMHDGKATKYAFRRYKKQEKRGVLGYGVVSMKDGKVCQIFRSEDEGGIKKALKCKGKMALLHHRHPTSTPNLAECTHPIFVSNSCLDFDYYVVHNGIISNANAGKEKYEKLGFQFTTEINVKTLYQTKGKKYIDKTSTKKFNDSESFAIDIALTIEGEQDKMFSEGSIAFVVLQVKKDTQKVLKVYFGRNLRNPLVIDNVQGDHFTLASEGDGEEVQPHKLFCYDPETKEITDKDLEIGYIYRAPVTTPKPEDKTPSPWSPHLGRTAEQYIEGRGIREPMGFLPGAQRSLFPAKQEKETKREITDEKVIFSGHGSDRTFHYQLKGDFLIHTKVHKDVITIVNEAEWRWYKDVVYRMTRLQEEIKECSRKLKRNKNDPYYEERIRELRKDIHKNNDQYDMFSTMVNNRSERGRIMAEVSANDD